MTHSHLAAARLLLVIAALAGCTRDGSTARADAIASGDTVWFWFATCHGPAMTLEVRLDSRDLYKTTFPLCRADFASSYSQGQAAKIAFWFQPRRQIVWRGYRDEDDTTRSGERIEGDVWEAGADSSDLLLGVSFITSDRITMNTIHIAHPTTPDSSEIAKGLMVLTYPSPSPK